MAALSTKTITNLNGMTFNEHYGNTVSRFGQDLALATSQLNDQKTVQKMLEKQRESVMGVSVDEVANLIIYQRAFQGISKTDDHDGPSFRRCIEYGPIDESCALQLTALITISGIT